MKVSKEVLDQYIYDLGYEKALEFWKLSDLQVENILYKKPINTIPEPYTDPVEATKKYLDEDKAKIIWSVINANYKYLRKDYIRSGKLDEINIRSENPEDKFHNAIIKIVERLENFNYISDEKTLEYIRSRLFFEKKTDRTVQFRLNKKISFIYDSETTLNNLPDDSI